MKYVFVFASLAFMFACNVDAQTSADGRSIPVTVSAGADVTIIPVKEDLKHFHYGYLQMGTAYVYPVYCSSKNVECTLEGTLFIIPQDCTGFEYKRMYLSKAEKKLVKLK